MLDAQEIAGAGAFVWEANQNFSKLIDEVESGETIVITKHGRPVAEVRPVVEDRARRASLLLSEDLQDGFAVEGVSVVNPFAIQDWDALAQRLGL